MKKRKIELVARKVTFAEAEEADNKYYQSLTSEELLKECFDLRRLNYFGSGRIPRIKKVVKVINKYEKYKA
jgi:hypothetical protein